MIGHGDRLPEAPDAASERYVTPKLTLVGNLNDLLASGGTKDCDSAVPTPGGLDAVGTNGC
jgi:hypothetical protein